MYLYGRVVARNRLGGDATSWGKLFFSEAVIDSVRLLATPPCPPPGAILEYSCYNVTVRMYYFVILP